MFLLKPKLRSDVLNAIVPGAEGTAYATIRQNKTGKPLLEQCGFHPLAPGQDVAASIQQLVSKRGLNKAPCTTVLDISEYHLMMVEAPEVPQAELKAAIRWRIRDLIDFHIDDAVLDVFDAPPSGARGVQEHLYVVVARAALVKERVELLRDAGAQLEIIDIPELALRNIAAQLPHDDTGQALLYFEANRGLVTLTRDGTLYLARSMDMGYRQLQDASVPVDRLALELQRSMDYYDRHFQQAPVSSITLCPLPASLPDLADQLEQQVGIPVKQFQLEDIVQIASGVVQDRVAECLLAIGAALRSETAAL